MSMWTRHLVKTPPEHPPCGNVVSGVTAGRDRALRVLSRLAEAEVRSETRK